MKADRGYHYVIRVLMQEAAASRGIDPQRVSFTGALKVLRCRLPECPAGCRGRSRWYRDLVAEIAEEVLPERRDRIQPEGDQEEDEQLFPGVPRPAGA